MHEVSVLYLLLLDWKDQLMSTFQWQVLALGTLLDVTSQ